jgi:MurE/MurF fusion protein
MSALTPLHTPEQACNWLRQAVPQGGTGQLQIDSRQIRPGDAFIAWPGAAHDARQFVFAALAQGASACLVEADQVQSFALDDARIAIYSGLKADLGTIASLYYDQPSQALDVVAITGTNGKTSCAWWLSQALSQIGRPSAMVGTLGVGVVPHVTPTGLTTPDPVLLHKHLRQFVDQGLSTCVMEASSIGIEERRLDGVAIRVAVFTNFSQDHLDYHGDMASYWHAKAKLFAWPGLQAAVLNLDELHSGYLQSSLQTNPTAVWTYGLASTAARIHAKHLRHEAQGMVWDVCEGDQCVTLASKLRGQFNVLNMLAVIASMRALGVPLTQAVHACAQLQPVPGRMQCVGGQGSPLVSVDYAHTPDALDKTLRALRPLAQAQGGKLWCIFGCGGDRDPIKRPLMAAVAERFADHVMVTSDNPRSESPQHIICQILVGFANASRVEVDIDRASAIADVLAQAQDNDVILIAGKGHEDYQETAGVRTPFSDLEHAQLALSQRKRQGAAS